MVFLFRVFMSVCACVCVSIDPPQLLSAAASIFSYCSDSVEKRESFLLLLPYWTSFTPITMVFVHNTMIFWYHCNTMMIIQRYSLMYRQCSICKIQDWLSGPVLADDFKNRNDQHSPEIPCWISSV